MFWIGSFQELAGCKLELIDMGVSVQEDINLQLKLEEISF